MFGYLRLFCAGMIGVAALIATITFPEEIVARSGLAASQLKFLAGLQSALFLAVAIFVGVRTSRRTRLASRLADINNDRAQEIFLAVIASALVAFVLGAAVAAAQGWLVGNVCAVRRFFQMQESALSALDPPLAARLLYGGVTEEILMRWGVMGAITWFLLKSGFAKGAAPVAIIVSALLFAAGHLPALYTFTFSPPPAFVIFASMANFAFGCLFGAVFWKTTLEGAMVAHAGAHLGMAAFALSLA